MPSVVRAKQVTGPDKEENGQDGQGRAKPTRRILSKTTVTKGHLSRSPEPLSTELLGNSSYLTRFIRSMADALNENESKTEAYIATIEEEMGQEKPSGGSRGLKN